MVKIDIGTTPYTGTTGIEISSSYSSVVKSEQAVINGTDT